MKNFIVIFFLILLSFTYAQDCTSTLKVNTNRSNAQIYIDMKKIGEGNIVVNLPLGKHDVLIREANREWNSEIIKDSVLLNNCAEIKELDYKFQNEILLNTNPQDVYVFENDSLIGHTPLFVQQNFSDLKLEKPKYDSLLVSLSRVKESKPIELNFTGKVNNNGSFVKSSWFKVLLGTTVALGATAAYFKIKADNRYSEYLDTKDPALLDKTNKFDLYAGVAFGALQINFGLLIYYFLTED